MASGLSSLDIAERPQRVTLILIRSIYLQAFRVYVSRGMSTEGRRAAKAEHYQIALDRPWSAAGNISQLAFQDCRQRQLREFKTTMDELHTVRP